MKNSRKESPIRDKSFRSPWEANRFLATDESCSESARAAGLLEKEEQEGEVRIFEFSLLLSPVSKTSWSFSVKRSARRMRKRKVSISTCFDARQSDYRRASRHGLSKSSKRGVSCDVFLFLACRTSYIDEIASLRKQCLCMQTLERMRRDFQLLSS